MLANLSSHFVNIAPDKVDMEITQSLAQIRQFFGVDRCTFLEVLKDCGGTRGLFKTGDEASPDEAFSAASHPWAYHQLIEQKFRLLYPLSMTFRPKPKQTGCPGTTQRPSLL